MVKAIELVDFMCQCGGSQRYADNQENLISGCVSEGVSRSHQHVNQTEYRRLPSSMWMAIIQSFEGLNRTKRQRKSEFAPCLNCPWMSVLLVLGPSNLDWDWDLHHWLPWFLGLKSWAESAPLALLGLQLGDGRKWDLASITYSMSQFFTINLLLQILIQIYRQVGMLDIDIQISYWFCFLREPWLIQQ